MSDNYAKLACDIIHSSIWCQPDDGLCKLWVTLLAMADRDGVVSASDIGIARAVGHSSEVTRANLTILAGPDPDSKNPAREGRRIEPLPQGGYRLLNYEVYRDRSSPDEKAAKHAERQRRYRERKAKMSPGTTAANPPPANPPTIAGQAAQLDANRTSVPCPQCGGQLRRFPRRDGSGHVYGHGRSNGTGCNFICDVEEYKEAAKKAEPAPLCSVCGRYVCSDGETVCEPCKVEAAYRG